MNFAALPPEVNSALMYTGAGSGPIRAAATAWQTMSAELESASQAYQSVVAGLADDSWHGPSSISMAAAAAPYVAWLSATATQAGQAATQATAAARAYETAFTMTVPPPVIAANRTKLSTLVATNFLGQNAPAIAATEAHYGQMWAQDATAMYGYAANAAAATKLAPFTAPKQNTNPAAADSGSYQGAGEEGLLLDIGVTAIEVGSLAPFEGGGAGLEFGSLAIEAASLGPFQGIGALGGLGLTSSAAPAAGAGSVAGFRPTAGLAGVGRVGATWASVGKAVPLGSLSVPQAWAAAAPSALRQVTLVSAQSTAAAASAVATGGAEIPYAEMALASMAGRAVAGTAGLKRERPEPASRTLSKAPPKPPQESEAADSAVRPVVGIVAELRALVELRDTGILTEEKFGQRKQCLLDGR